MAKKEIVKHDFDVEYPLWGDIDKSKVQFKKLDNGYSVCYGDEERYESENGRGYRSRSMSFSQTYGGRKLKDADMQIEGDKIKVKGWFDDEK
ncbi:ECU03_1535 [Encephalitozoon cuniculi GB-M1]|uniref:ECU03_1535 protein n=1 Tax=Encephalitozoon cuniculi (strain GB-M1) TaxID=284813 RepID=I7IV36_ENCCU|nr:uncharacterized protein ECU03_1535 [Encephalitozoon cuniculi GB-M1]UYI28146.1 hypothetical protein J0A71_09g20440 [Encephalitozoon cuniculi]CCI73921.1 ECU03_1535 [Encephalitozoon cuniculi GB-M1]